VRYVLKGSVRKAANKVRITAQLADGMTGNHIWADRYDREFNDIFALQDEITETIVGRIATEVGVSEMDRARRKPPANLDAWELYQRGLWHSYKTTKEDNKEARNLFHESVERDPNFALAHAGIAFNCYIEVMQGFGDDPTEWLAAGLAAGEQAVALDDKDGFTHYALGRVLGLAGQGDRAIAEMEKSVALNPSFAHGYHGLGYFLTWYGRAADGIPMLDMAMRLSPHDPILWAMQTYRAFCCINIKNYDEAAAWARKARNSRSDQFWPHITLAVALARQDQLDEARAAIEEARRVKPDISLSVIQRLLPHLHPEYLERYIDALRNAGLPE
jgi:adenylate cyclase